MLEILRADVDAARARYENAKEAFWRVSAGNEKESTEVVAAARVQTEAMIGYTRALKRLNEFLLDGIVPEDLGGSGDSTAKGPPR